MRAITGVVVLLVVMGIFFAGNIFAEDGGLFKIAALSGKVLVEMAGSEDWIEAKIGDMLDKGDTIKTLEDGNVYLEIDPNNGFTLGPNSSFVAGNTFEKPLVAEPYSEAVRESVESVMAPEANQDSPASGT